MLAEPATTALLLTTLAILLIASVLFTRVIERLGVPVVLLFMILGMVGGAEGIGGLVFHDYQLAFRLGTVALVLILFDGGLNTSLSTIRRSFAPATVLATFGVAATAGLGAVAGRAFGLPWPEALLLGAIVSSTDAATVFAVLRGSRLSLKPRVGTTLELESGINDPMAVILTMTITAAIVGGAPVGWGLIWEVPLQLAVGLVAGLAAGHGARLILNRASLTTGGLYPVLTLATAFVAFGAATLLDGSGFLAVYVAAVILGNGPLPYRSGLTRVHDAMAWLCQITMFLMLGLLVVPSQLPAVAWIGLPLGIILAFVARPLATIPFLIPFGFNRREMTYIGWVGLRGAVPIILATFPVLAGVPGAERIFHIVFFIVVVAAFVPGATIRWATRKLELQGIERPAPPAALEINSTRSLQGDLISFHIDPALAIAGAKLADIPFPEGAAAVLIVRDGELHACRGVTELRVDDHVYIFCQPQDRPFMELLFGRPQD